MKNSQNGRGSKSVIRLKVIRLVLLCLGILLSASIVTVYALYDPFSITSFEPENLPQNIAEQTEETYKEEPETEETIQEEETFTDKSDDVVTDEENQGSEKFADESDDIISEENAESQSQEKVEGKESDESFKKDESLTEKADETSSPESRLVKQTVTLKPANRKDETEPTMEYFDVVPDAVDQKQGIPHIKDVFLLLCGLLCLDIFAILVISVIISVKKKANLLKDNTQLNDQRIKTVTLKNESGCSIQVAGIHNIGARPYQEDSLGVDTLKDGVLAVVADGMGGLSGGDRVSQKIVYTMLEYGKKLPSEQMDGVLETMVNGVNQEVNRMLGPDGLYKSGSTLLAVLIRNQQFQWITVGDSRIYYYHQGKLSQLNQEHNVGQDMLIKATRGELSFEDARNAPKKGRVTSFIGMGTLKYVDKSCRSIKLVAGDRLLLMTDGVFNALPDQTILSVLANYPDVQMEATKLEQLVLQAGHPKQDNFTAIILGC